LSNKENEPSRKDQLKDKKYQYILKATNAGTWQWNVQTGETIFNEKWAEIIGYTLEELEPTTIETWKKFTYPEDLKLCQEKLKSHFRGEKDSYECKHRMKHKNGNWVWVLDRGAVIEWTEDGKPLWMFGTHIDITDLKETQEKLRKQTYKLNERNKELSCFYKMSEIVQSGEHTLEELLEQFVHLIPPGFQYPDQTCARLTFDETRYHTDNFRETDTKITGNIYFHGAVKGSLEVFLLKDFTKTDKAPFLDKERKLIDSLAERIGRIAERKIGEQKLVESESKFRNLFETMAQGVVYHDKTGQIISANPAAERILGLSLSRMQGRTSMDPRWKAVHEDGSPFPGKDHPAMVALRTGQPVYGELMGVYHPKEGEFHWIKVNALPRFYNGEEEPYQVYASFEDITTEVEARQALQKSREKFFQLFDNMKSGVALYEAVDNGKDFRVIDLNKAGERIENIDKEEVIGKKVTDIFPGVEDFGLLEVFRKVWETGEPQDHTDAYYKDERVEGWRENRVYKLPSGIVVAVYDDVTERIKAEEEIKKFKTITDNALTGTCITDMNADIVYINDYYANIHGYSPGEVMGENIALFHTSKQLNEMMEKSKPVFQKQDRFPAAEFWHKHRTGKEFPMLMSGVMIEDKAKERRFMAISAVDISQQKNLEFSLKQQKEELMASNQEIEAMNEELLEREKEARRANQAKSEFLATMSHELRTPLNGVIGFSEILKKSELNESQQDYLEIILNSAKNLLEIISDILDLSKLESEMTKIEPKQMNVRETLKKSLEIVESKAKEKDLEIGMTLAEDCPEYVRCDPARLKQILLNLLSNAVKFTDRGEVTLSVVVKEMKKETKTVTLRFSVKDTGIGIKEEDRQKIMEAFTQVDMSNTREYGGTGLGLTIANRLLDRMGSSLRLTSTYGKGSNFYFDLTLPYEEMPKSSQDENADEQEGTIPKIGNKTILIAEDNRNNMKYAKIALKLISNDIRIFEAGDGQEAYDLFRQHRPDLILMDLVMPELSGFQATKMIREKDKRVPIVAMTAKALREDREKCLKSGMNDFISKPVELDKLKKVLERHLDENR